MRRMSAFSYFLRTGRRLPDEVEQKFNPWHDPEDGRFTFAGRGRQFGGGHVGSVASAAGSRRISHPLGAPKLQVRARPTSNPARPGPKQDSAKPIWNLQEAVARTRREMRAPKPAPPVWRKGGYMDTQEVKLRAANAMRMYRVHLALGMRPEEAAGWAANSEAESRSDFRSRQLGGPGRGLFQWGADAAKFDRRRDFQRLFGHSIEQSTEAEQLAFRDWELANTQASAARKISRAKTAGEVAAAITLYYEIPDDKKRRAIDRSNLADQILYHAGEGR